MRRDANFGIGDAEIQVKEKRETDKSDIILVFRYPCCRNLRKRWREKLTSISLVGLSKFNFRQIFFFFFRQFFVWLVYSQFIFILKEDKRSPRGLNPCARIVPHKKQPTHYRETCSTFTGTKLIYSKPGRYFKFSKTQKNTLFLYTFQKLIVMITRMVN